MATKDGKKSGGRKKGTPNKRTATVTEYLNNKGANPVEYLSDRLLESAKAGDTEKADYIAVCLLPYHSPKLTAMKIDANVEVETRAEWLQKIADD